MKLTATFRAPRFDLAAYQRVLDRHMAQALSAAAFAWLDAVLPSIPVWSGASRATFLHLARRIGYSIPIGQANTAPDRQGLGLSSSIGDFSVGKQRGQYFFVYQTTLEHLIYNEFNNANTNPDPSLFFRLITPGPYHFQPKGQRAFQQVADNVRLPNPFNSLRIRVIRV